MKKRNSYIDLLKGILIIMVVYGHIVYCIGQNTNACLNSLPYRLTSYIANNWIAPYYMAAFFIVTGYCSNFESPIHALLKKNFKTLIIPAIAIPIITAIITPKVNTQDAINNLKTGNLPWFLLALFWSKNIYGLLVNHINNKWIISVILLLLSITGCFLLLTAPTCNYLSIFHAFAFCIFLPIGQFIRNKNISNVCCYISAISYISITVLNRFVLHLGNPSLCAIITFPLWMYPNYILLAVSGTITLLCFSKILKSNKILEYLGRNSLVIYLTHFYFLTFFSITFKDYIVLNSSNTFHSSIIILAMTIGGCCFGSLFATVLNFKYLRSILGKF